jgi:lipoprotein-releasing system ATP-binding protein
MFVKAIDVHKSYGTYPVLKGVHLEVQRGEVVAIVGASGAGKSTLLHVLGTLDAPERGQILINGIAIEGLKGRELSVFRNRHIGFIFQFHQLLPEFTALENICMPAWIAGMEETQAKERAKQLMELLGISSRSENKPAALSGGEQQRVAIARALVNKPDLILADEPSGNLDSVNARALHELFFELREKLNQTFIIVTHNPELSEMSDRRLTIRDGIIMP